MKERILIFTDAWLPQMNGVVRTLQEIVVRLRRWGHEVAVVGPHCFTSIPCPSYPEIKLAMDASFRIQKYFSEFQPTRIHISTEGPLGYAARRACRRAELQYTTCYHTKFPEYLRARAPIPERWTYRALKLFHRRSEAVMVATPSLKSELRSRGFQRLVIWSRGVDTETFRPLPSKIFDTLPRPISLYVGRVAVEKNISEFLKLDLPGTKVVVGDGPQLEELQAKYPNAVFMGRRSGAELAECYAGADVFVFPSVTDTFGLVVLEALACGTPVAAFPVPGPRDILSGTQVGALNFDLRSAVMEALECSREKCRNFALEHTWEKSAEQFLGHLCPPHPNHSAEDAYFVHPPSL